MNANAVALGHVTTTENGGAALSLAGATHAMTAGGDRGASLAALSLQSTTNLSGLTGLTAPPPPPTTARTPLPLPPPTRPRTHVCACLCAYNQVEPSHVPAPAVSHD